MCRSEPKICGDDFCTEIMHTNLLPEALESETGRDDRTFEKMKS